MRVYMYVLTNTEYNGLRSTRDDVECGKSRVREQLAAGVEILRVRRRGTMRVKKKDGGDQSLSRFRPTSAAAVGTLHVYLGL